ncbi:MAG TPA: hypothetical protein ENH82_02435 [bacterium]|nr:hypothetical protein [bacterium]
MDDVKNQQPNELFGYVSFYPGSLIEMAGKVKNELNNPKNETKTSPVFNWFVIQGTNTIIHDIRNFLDKRNSKNWMELTEVLAGSIIPVPQISNETKIMKYLDHITVECGLLPEKNFQKKTGNFIFSLFLTECLITGSIFTKKAFVNI